MRRLFLLVICVLFVGCSEREDHQISATAAATALPDGSVQVRDATARERASLEKTVEKREEIDKRFPGSPVPRGAPSEHVIEVSVPGVLKLRDGRSVQLDGISCNEKAAGYLRRLLQEDSVSVVVLPSGEATTQQPIRAEVWSVENLTVGPSYSNVVETAITSGWCELAPTLTSERRDRYIALAQAFQHPASAR